MRGKVTNNYEYEYIGGITPAYAGKREREKGILDPNRDHPRVCGEKTGLLIPDKIHPGSPPRMRGKGKFLDVWFYHHGITPAYAGKRV